MDKKIFKVLNLTLKMEISSGFSAFVAFVKSRKADHSGAKLTPEKEQLLYLYMLDREFEND